MIFINEWLPNPVGADATGEWVELFNSGQSISLNGWALKTGNGKKIFLKNYHIDAGGYLVLKRSETKLTLRNNGETIFLYDDKGVLVDQSGFLGSAPEGKSFSRITGANPQSKVQHFVFAEPTPGALNAISGQLALISSNYPFGAPLNRNLTGLELTGLTLGAALLLSVFSLILFKRNEMLSNLFFGRDEEIR